MTTATPHTSATGCVFHLWTPTGNPWFQWKNTQVLRTAEEVLKSVLSQGQDDGVSILLPSYGRLSLKADMTTAEMEVELKALGQLTTLWEDLAWASTQLALRAARADGVEINPAGELTLDRWNGFCLFDGAALVSGESKTYMVSISSVREHSLLLSLSGGGACCIPVRWRHVLQRARAHEALLENQGLLVSAAVANNAGAPLSSVYQTLLRHHDIPLHAPTTNCAGV